MGLVKRAQRAGEAQEMNRGEKEKQAVVASKEKAGALEIQAKAHQQKKQGLTK